MNRLDQTVKYDVATACFLNALARECDSIKLENLENKYYYCIPLTGGDEIRIPLTHLSSVGLHKYATPSLISGSIKKSISFATLLEKVLDEPSLVGFLSESHKHIFSSRVLESHQNTMIAASESPYGQKLFNSKLNFKQAEQGLLVGHSFHPAPKSREQFSPQDAKRYTPELGGRFQLYWIAIHKDIAATGSSNNMSIDKRITELLESDSKLRESVQNTPLANQHDHILAPMHPWQWRVICEMDDIKSYLKSGQIQELGELGESWYPTSSTRALYCPSSPYMLKFSLSVKLTNSVRNLSLKEVQRGIQLNELFTSKQILSTEKKDGDFNVIQEPAYVGIINQQGQVIDETLVVFRENPLVHSPEEEAVVLATLTQQNPYSGPSLLASRIRHYAQINHISPIDAAQKWFNAYCRHVVLPLFKLQADHGIVLLAHQQNIILRMEEGFPVGSYYRDCQGTGYTDLAFERYTDMFREAKQHTENYWDLDKVKRYFAYYLIINSTFSVIGSVAADLGMEESQFMVILRTQLEKLRQQGVCDSKCLDYVLDSSALCCKGNFFCYIQNFNENSIPDPAVIYFDLNNPILNAVEESYA
ncbi:N(2)-citryl-N(6)-acetyl-N(6)-hydroxylysine synthase [Vibrio sp. S4M6]|uniref:IucA/IucC family protein n=1 Tax=Vibrio sinus TaxID=2946865 RepID=UPI00202A97BA|nr:IucA/IucC family protein [Vibrio sinus]MCL9780400.1 N(2)-citryl-N(6)-acetyl-N(6)-hydroxylysine synthase [Vibrio sinus]